MSTRKEQQLKNLPSPGALPNEPDHRSVCLKMLRIKQGQPLQAAAPLPKCYYVHPLDAEPRTMMARCRGQLLGVTFDPGTAQWRQKWRLDVPVDHPDHYPDALVVLGGQKVYLLRAGSGLQFYAVSDGDEPRLLAEDTRLHDAQGFLLEGAQILMGWFYPDSDTFGVVTRSGILGKVQFYGVSANDLKTQTQYPLQRLDRKVDAFGEGDFFSHRLPGTTYDSIFVRTKNGLDCFYFDANYNLQKRFSYLELGPAEDCEKIRFERWDNTHSSLLVFNSAGLAFYNIFQDKIEFSFITNAVSVNGCHSLEIVKGDSWGKKGSTTLAVSGVKGLQLFSLDVEKKRMTSVLKDDDFPRSILFSRPIGSGPGIVLQTDENDIYFTSVEETPEEVIKEPLIIEENDEPLLIKTIKPVPTAIMPQKLDSLQVKPAPHMLWTSQWDTEFLKNALDEKKGKLSLKIPLVSAPALMGNTFQIFLYYNSQSDTPSICGDGWNVGLPSNFISVGRQSFEDEDVYFLTSGQGTEELIPVEGSQGKKIFRAEAYKDTSVTYDLSKEQWIVETPERTLTFGGPEAVQMGLKWPNWNGAGTDKAALRQVPISWYLISSTEKNYGADFMYEYRKTSKKLVSNGHEYTHSINLSKVKAKGLFEVQLQYKEKKSEEYHTFFAPANEPFELPMSFENDVYLEKMLISTDNYQQHLHFEYILHGQEKKRLLAELSQIVGPTVRKILSMEYVNFAKKISKITAANGATFLYQYKQVELPKVLPSAQVSIPLISKPYVSIGSNYRVLVYEDLVITRKMCIDVIENDVRKTVALIDYFLKPEIKVFSGKENFIVTLNEKEKRTWAYFVSKTDNEWRLYEEENAVFNYNTKLTSVQRFKNGILAATATGVVFKEWNREKKKWVSENLIVPETSFFGANNSIIAALKDDILYVYYRVNGTFKNIQHKTHNVKQGCHDFINQFDHDKETMDKVRDFLLRTAFQMNDKTIMTARSLIKDHKIYLSLQLYFVNKNYKIIVYDKEFYKVNINDLSHEITDFDKEGGTLTLGYDYKNHKYSIIVKSVGNNKKYSKKDKKDIIKVIHEKQKEDLKKSVLVPFRETSTVHITHDGAVGDKFYIYNTGNGYSQIEKGFPLKSTVGDNWIVQETPNTNSTLQISSSLYNQKYEFQKNEKFVNVFPNYFAHQRGNNTVILNLNSDGKVDQKITILNQTLITGNGTHLETISRSSRFLHEVEYVVTPLHTLTKWPEQIMVSMEKVILQENDRITNFEYLGKCNAENKCSVTVDKFWGNNVNFSGKEQTIMTEKNSLSPMVQVSLYDCRGKLEKTEEKNADQTKDIDEAKAEDDQVIFDKTKAKMIVKHAPYFTKDDEIAYIGFENYEIKSGWIFKEQNVKSGKSFTGSKALELNGQDSISRLIIPKLQSGIYVVSSWVRKGGEYIEGDVLNELSVKILIEGTTKLMRLNSIVQRVVGNWTYVELYLDFQVLRDSYSGFLQYQKAENQIFPSPADVKFSFQVEVSSQDGGNLIVDHVRFSPIILDFEANVFNEKTGNLVNIIKTNGEIERRFYNAFDKEIATVNEEFTLESFETEYLITDQSDYKKQKIVLKFDSGQVFDFDLNNFTENSLHIVNPRQFSTFYQTLQHSGNKKGGIHLNYSGKSFAYRMLYNLQTLNSKMDINIKPFKVSIESNTQHWFYVFENGREITKLPQAGELLIYVEGHRVAILLEGKLVFDRFVESEKPEVTVELSGEVLLKELMQFKNPGVTLEFYNEIGEKKQIIKVTSETSKNLMEIIHDSMGREAVSTKYTTIPVAEKDRLFEFVANFLENEPVFWKTGIMSGLVSKYNSKDEGYPYNRVTFKCSPLAKEHHIGLPGKKFSIAAKFHKVKHVDINIPLINNLFPKENGYHHEVTRRPNQSLLVTVYDEKHNKVAKYTHVDGYDKTLSTFEYDEFGNMVKALSPNYHNVAKIWEWKKVKDEEKEKQFGVFFDYDKRGNVVKKISSDTGTQEFSYDDLGRKKYEAIKDSLGIVKHVLYYNHDDTGNLIATGNVVNIHAFGESSEPLIKNSFQKFHYFDDLAFAKKRDKLKKIITSFHWEPEVDTSNQNDKNDATDVRGSFIEEYEFNTMEMLTSKSTVIASNDLDTTERFVVEMNEYNARGIYKVLSYPLIETGSRFNLYHTYDNIGNLIGLGSRKNPFKYFRFEYNSFGNLVEEQHLPGMEHEFNRKYEYNSPGYLRKISDPYLEQTLEYTKGGYGQEGFGDGIIMNSMFKAFWPKKADKKWFALEDDLIRKCADCYQSLTRSGVLSDSFVIARMPDNDDFLKMPVSCLGSKQAIIQQTIARRIQPEEYGYKYGYGSHDELLYAKYYYNNDLKNSQPLTIGSIKSATYRNSDGQASEIWTNLINEKIVITNSKTGDILTAPGVVAEQLLNLKDIEKLLNEYNLSQLRLKFQDYIQQMFVRNSTVSISDISEMMSMWTGCLYKMSCSRDYKVEASEMYSNLLNNTIIENGKPNLKVFLPAVQKILSKSPRSATNILKVLIADKKSSLLTHPFDFEAFESDANGNHKKFYSGSKRYTFDYDEGSNKISKIHLTDLTSQGIPTINFDFAHDIRGNVIRAMHKNITSIKYHNVSQRTAQVNLANGSFVRFAYDAAGERILKYVYNKDKSLLSRTLYVRDEQGRVLVDVKTKYFTNLKHKVSTQTIYIYGKRGLVGFVRKGSFYSVITDHSGSVRLVVKKGRIVASYDYQPYEEVHRSFGDDPDAKIDYLYTGQEYDEETGLYNYHARLYDPSIGRFYQADPQAQYFNPYMYGGNSPVSLIDPDGEFFMFIAAIIGAVAFGYLGGAAANNNWNPAKWNWKSPSTYFGIIGGAVTGAMLPFTGVAALGAIGAAKTSLIIGASVGIAYVQGAAANGSWNPAEWDWSSPMTINAIFTGFTTGLSIASGVRVAHTTGVQWVAKTFQYKHATTIFLGISYTAGGGIAYAKVAFANKEAAFWKWDWSDPATFAGLIDGFDSGFGWPQNLAEAGRGIFKFAKRLKGATKLMKSTLSGQKLKSLLKVQSIMKDPMFKTTASLVMGYVMASGANESIGEWKNEFSTYEAFLNGMFFGKSLRNLKKTIDITDAGQIITRINKYFESALGGKKYDFGGFNINSIVEKYLHDIADNVKKPLRKQLNAIIDDFSTQKIDIRGVITKMKNEGLEGSLQRKINIINSDIDDTGPSRRTYYPDDKQDFMLCGGSRRRRNPSFLKCAPKMVKSIPKYFSTSNSDPKMFRNIIDTTSTLHMRGVETNYHREVSRGMYAAKIANGDIPEVTLITHNNFDIYLMKNGDSYTFDMWDKSKETKIHSEKPTALSYYDPLKEFKLPIETIEGNYFGFTKNDITKNVDFTQSKMTLQLKDTSSANASKLIKIGANDFTQGGTIQKAVESCVDGFKRMHETGLQNLLEKKPNAASEIDFNGFMHGFMLKQFGDDYNVFSQLVAGKGVPDLVLQPKGNIFGKIIIVEIKMIGDKGIGSSMDQIKNNKYPELVPIKNMGKVADIITVDPLRTDRPVIIETYELTNPPDFIASVSKQDLTEFSSYHSKKMAYGVPNNRKRNFLFHEILGRAIASENIKEVSISNTDNLTLKVKTKDGFGYVLTPYAQKDVKGQETGYRSLKIPDTNIDGISQTLNQNIGKIGVSETIDHMSGQYGLFETTTEKSSFIDGYRKGLPIEQATKMFDKLDLDKSKPKSSVAPEFYQSVLDNQIEFYEAYNFHSDTSISRNSNIFHEMLGKALSSENIKSVYIGDFKKNSLLFTTSAGDSYVVSNADGKGWTSKKMDFGENFSQSVKRISSAKDIISGVDDATKQLGGKYGVLKSENDFTALVNGYIEGLPVDQNSRWRTFYEVNVKKDSRIDLIAQLVDVEGHTVKEKNFIVFEMKRGQADLSAAMDQLTKYSGAEFQPFTSIDPSNIEFYAVNYKPATASIETSQFREKRLPDTDIVREPKRRPPQSKRSISDVTEFNALAAWNPNLIPETKKAAKEESAPAWCRFGETNESFWCFRGQLNILVTPMSEECRLQTSSVPLQHIEGDFYSNCHKIGDDVYCEGDRSWMLVSQDPRPNLMDTMTAQLILFRVVQHSLVGFWHSLVAKKHSPMESVDKSRRCQWEKALEALEGMQATSGQDWSQKEIEGCREMIEEIGELADSETVEVVEERLSALAEDLAECLHADDTFNPSVHSLHATFNNKSHLNLNTNVSFASNNPRLASNKQPLKLLK